MILAGLPLLVAVPDFLVNFEHVLAMHARNLSRLVGFVLPYVGLVALLFEVVADATRMT